MNFFYLGPDKKRNKIWPGWLVVATLFFSAPLVAQPVIGNFTPASGPVGTLVTITGNNFNPSPAANIVYFGATKAIVSTASVTSLTVTVPAGATYQPISVTTNTLTCYSAKPFIVTFPGGKPMVQNIDQSQNSFEREIDSTTDLHPNGIAIADLDGDGKPDIVTANNYSTAGQPASISVLRNTSSIGAISLAPRMDIATGVQTYAIAAGDLDGDGKPDIVSSSIVDQSISIFKNTSTPGNISFAQKVDYATGSDPFSIAIADMDLDGKPDVVAANYLSGTLSLFRNTSTGATISFAPKVDLTTGFGPNFVAAGDLDGDGKPDLAAVNALSNTVSIFRNTSTPGAISFASKADLAANGSPYGVAIGDLDGDGKPDLALSNNGSNSYSVLRNTSNTGNISFAPRVDYPCGAQPNCISIGDLNGDGKPDIVVPSLNLSVSQNNCSAGTISFNGQTYLWPVFTSYVVAIADLDGDGKSDLVGAGYSTDRISLTRNKNNEPTIKSFTPTDAVAGATVTITGYDLDGATAVSFGGVPATAFTIVSPDTLTAIVGAGASGYVAVANQYGVNRLGGFIFHAPPTITSFTPVNAGTGDTIHITGTYLNDVTAVDLGGTAAAYFQVNSFTSITAVVGSGSSGSIRATSPYGTGSLSGFTYFPPPVITSFTPDSGGTGTTISITGNNFTGVSAVTIGGTPAASFIVNSSTSITAVVSDGAAGSIAVATTGGKAISAGIFIFPPPTITSVTPASGPIGSSVTITGSNFRKDTANNVVLFGAVKAQVTAASPTSLTVVVPPGVTYDPITIALNNYTIFDRQPFIATFPPGAAAISDSSFKWRASFTTNEDPRSIYLADLDGDGKPDLITQNYFSGSVSILRNTGSLNTFSFTRQPDLISSLGYNVYLTMTVGDVNGDGKPDIVVSNWYDVVSVYKNTSSPGAISFASKVDFPATDLNRGITIVDVDGDGRADLALANADGFGSNPVVSVYRNTGNGGTISFAPRVDYSLGGIAFGIRNGDVDGDGKPDIALVTEMDVEVLRNNSPANSISLEPYKSFPSNLGNQAFTIADFNGDGRPDLAPGGQGIWSVLKNTSTPGTISFDPKVDFPLPATADAVVAGQLDGDGKPDIVVIGDGARSYLYRNTSSAGTLSFSPGVAYVTPLNFNWVYSSVIGDIDGDGKPEIVVTNGADNQVSIFRSQIGERTMTVCASSDLAITADSAGTTYQWQVNTGNGFVAITDNTLYRGAASDTLNIHHTPDSLNLYQYRCLKDGIAGTITNLSVNPVITPSGTATAPGQVCGNGIYNVTFTETNSVPLNSTIGLWRATDTGHYTLRYEQNYYGYPSVFNQQDSMDATENYFFTIRPPTTALCARSTNSDTVLTRVAQLTTPIISSNGNVIAVTNPDPSADYTWQVQAAGGIWNDITPAAAGTTYTILASGTYRVSGVKGICTAPSNSLAVTITGIVPVPANSMGIVLYPNPSTDRLILDSLNLSDGWLTMEIISADGKQRIRTVSIKNQTIVPLSIGELQSGFYIALLRRKKGVPAIIKFLKL